MAEKRVFLPSRRLIQLYAALLYNAHAKGFIKGDIYTGPIKAVCVPGLNCYSCPGAVGACPLGSLQNALATSGKRAPYYVIGILLLFGIIFGRTICGYLCPTGLLQELLHKIPVPKLKKNRCTRMLSGLKYIILAVLVIFIPLWMGFKDYPLPAFCKYICPAGTLQGAVGLPFSVSFGSDLRAVFPLCSDRRQGGSLRLRALRQMPADVRNGHPSRGRPRMHPVRRMHRRMSRQRHFAEGGRRYIAGKSIGKEEKPLYSACFSVYSAGSCPLGEPARQNAGSTRSPP